MISDCNDNKYNIFTMFILKSILGYVRVLDKWEYSLFRVFFIKLTVDKEGGLILFLINFLI